MELKQFFPDDENSSRSFLRHSKESKLSDLSDGDLKVQLSHRISAIHSLPSAVISSCASDSGQILHRERRHELQDSLNEQEHSQMWSMWWEVLISWSHSSPTVGWWMNTRRFSRIWKEEPHSGSHMDSWRDISTQSESHFQIISMSSSWHRKGWGHPYVDSMSSERQQKVPGSTLLSESSEIWVEKHGIERLHGQSQRDLL